MGQTFTGKVEFRNSSNKPILTIDPDSGFVQIVYQTGSGFHMMELTNTSSLSLNGTGNDWGARLDGIVSTLWLGGNGKPGMAFVRDANKNNAIVLDGSHANIRLGGNGQDGDIGLFPASVTGETNDFNKATIWLDADAGDITLKNADCAEEFEVAEAADCAPGTVMVIDDEGKLRPSREAYDRRVAGVLSGAGDLKPGIVLGKDRARTDRKPVALVGKVYCQADAQFAAIGVGDLLTTSPTLGHAMKAADPLRAFGAVIGKALRPLATGQGLIPILIALQ